MKPWLDLIRSCILPALSISAATAGFDIELWHLLRFFPYAVRWGLYGEWRDITCGKGPKSCPNAAQASRNAARDTRRALSRVTASSASQTSGPAQQDRGPARALAKLSHTNPCAVWSVIVTQVRSYANIGTSVVEAGRYLTQLSMDIAIFTVVESLTDPNKLNSNGTDVSDWLMRGSRT
jgi:THO complex subunit 2